MQHFLCNGGDQETKADPEYLNACRGKSMKYVLQHSGCVNAIVQSFDAISTVIDDGKSSLPSIAMTALLQVIQDFSSWTCRGDCAGLSTCHHCWVIVKGRFFKM